MTCASVTGPARSRSARPSACCSKPGRSWGALADRVRHTRLSNLKELRPGSAGRSEIRILYIFDPKRNAVLLAAGEKAGKWETWYRQAIPLAEQRYEDYLKQQEDIR
jgi:hypothetical protein